MPSTTVSANRVLVVIVGPTGTGKSELSLDLAESLGAEGTPAEIVNADAMQLYRGMDIGTAKLGADDQRGIPHHLLDVVQVALAAVKLAHEAATGGGADVEEIPEAAPAREERGRPGAAARGDTGRNKGRLAKKRGKASSGDAGTARVYVSAGRTGGVRPQDLVGAIANETSLSGRDIGAIEITDNFSLVEIPESAMDEVVTALRGTRIKGNKVKAKPDAARR